MLYVIIRIMSHGRVLNARSTSMTDIEHEALCNEIDFLQREVDRYREQNRKLVNIIFKLKRKYENTHRML